MKLTGTSLIGLEPMPANGRCFHAENPATGAALEPPYHPASEEEVRRAAGLAGEARGILRALDGHGRAVFLRTVAEEIEGLGDALLERYTAESGLPRARAEGERGRTCAQLRMFADLVEEGSWVDARIEPADVERRPQPRPDLRQMLVPVGPVAVFGPANFPLAFTVAGGDSASAWAAGCPVVVKAHSSHPGVSEMVGWAVVRAVRRCGLPPGTFSLLFGSGREVGGALVRQPEIQAAAFTGSRRAGRELYDACAARPQPIPFFGELSSSNPVVILPGALGERGEAIVGGLLASVTLGVGQFCTNPGLVLVPVGSDGDRFVSKLAELLASMPTGVMLNAATRRSYQEAAVRLGSRPGVHTIVRSTTSDTPGAGGVQAGLWEARVPDFHADPVLGEEVFGPATLVLRWQNAAELQQFAAALEGQLTATIHACAGEAKGLVAAPWFHQLVERTGRIIFNGFPTGVEVNAAMVHGGPWPATTDARFTSVGTGAIRRFVRPVCYQDAPEAVLPQELRDCNPRNIRRLEAGQWTS
jgi:NADP-dependent aldehyde dehydrogenase